jgi:hypothetical protein
MICDIDIDICIQADVLLCFSKIWYNCYWSYSYEYFYIYIYRAVTDLTAFRCEVKSMQAIVQLLTPSQCIEVSYIWHEEHERER